MAVYIAHRLHCQDHAQARSAVTAMCCSATRAPTRRVRAAMFHRAAMEVLSMGLLQLCKQCVSFRFIAVFCNQDGCILLLHLQAEHWSSTDMPR